MAEADAPPALDPSEEARALWYALISRLFYAPPDSELLAGLSAGSSAREDAIESPFLDAWWELKRACRDAQPQTLREEFEALFVGVGKAPVTPYTSSYAASHAPDRHLLELKQRLGGWGLGRRERVFEAEDHVSALCDAMRWLIVQARPLEEQREFFNQFLASGVPLFCDAIKRSPTANFYSKVGEFARTFVAVENDAFDMHTAT
ncbi:MAG: TorD/DmsD family molecular chaperone [Burkholderiales bacterium]